MSAHCFILNPLSTQLDNLKKYRTLRRGWEGEVIWFEMNKLSTLRNSLMHFIVLNVSGYMAPVPA